MIRHSAGNYETSTLTWLIVCSIFYSGNDAVKGNTLDRLTFRLIAYLNLKNSCTVYQF